MGALENGGVGSLVFGSAFGAHQIFAPNRSGTFRGEGFGASRLKIGAPSVVVGFGVFGTPRFCVQRSQNL